MIEKEIDTVIVSSHEDGFNEVFMGKNQWYAITVRINMIPKLKYIAIYRAQPVSAITHVAEIESIEPYNNIYHKYIVYFKQNSIRKLPQPVFKNKGVPGPRGIIYTLYEKLLCARAIADITQ